MTKEIRINPFGDPSVAHVYERIARSEELCRENRIQQVSGFNPIEKHEVYRLRCELNQCKECDNYYKHNEVPYCTIAKGDKNEH